MKNKLLIICILLYCTSPCLAQLNSVITDASAEFPTTINGTVVRNYLDQYSIGFLIDNGISYFYSTAIGQFDNPSAPSFTNCTKMQLTSNWVIKDMQIFKDTVFFCGTDGSNNGLYGSFHINDLLVAGPHSITAYTDNYLVGINKMVVYDTLSATHIVAIGEGFLSPDTHSVILHVRDYVNIPSFVSHCIMPTTDNTHRVMLHDVLTVGNYVTFIGMDTRYSTKTLCVRRADKLNVILDNALDIHHMYYPSLSYNHILPSTNTRSAVVDNRYIATAHVCSDSTSPNLLLTINMIDAIVTLNSVGVQKSQHLRLSRLIEMKYMPVNKNLVLLYTLNGLDSYFLPWQPYYTTPYYLTYAYDNNNRYTSMDLLSRVGFISASRSFLFLQRTFPVTIPSVCIPNNSQRIETDPVYTKVDLQQSRVIYNVYLSNVVDNAITTPFRLKIECQD